MTDLVSQLVGALEHCEGVFMSHEINHINGGKIEDDALAIIRAALTAAKAGGWVAVENVPMPRDGGSYLVADAVRGMVAPHIRGVIYNNPGTHWDWQYGEAVTHWQPLPNPPKEQA